MRSTLREKDISSWSQCHRYTGRCYGKSLVVAGELRWAGGLDVRPPAFLHLLARDCRGGVDIVGGRRAIQDARTRGDAKVGPSILRARRRGRAKPGPPLRRQKRPRQLRTQPGVAVLLGRNALRALRIQEYGFCADRMLQVGTDKICLVGKSVADRRDARLLCRGAWWRCGCVCCTIR